jgi:hypothetical protein
MWRSQTLNLVSEPAPEVGSPSPRPSSGSESVSGEPMAVRDPHLERLQTHGVFSRVTFDRRTRPTLPPNDSCKTER